MRYRSLMKLISPHFLRSRFSVGLLTVFFLALAAFPSAAQENKPATPPAAADAKDKSPEKEAPLPADAHISQTIQLDGKPLHYNVTIGTLPVNDNISGKKIGEVVYTAYVVEGQDRPVTFALNGGPGASSVFLNLGAIGPKRIDFGEQGN